MMFTDSQLEVVIPGNYICDIHKLYFQKIKSITTHSHRFIETSYIKYTDKIMYTNQLYLANNLLTNESYWGTLNIGNDGIYFKLICKINVKDGIFETLYEPRCIIIYEYNHHGYSIHTTSVPLYKIPSAYKIIPNDRKKWNELCELIIKCKINALISCIINILELRLFINEFLLIIN